MCAGQLVCISFYICVCLCVCSGEVFEKSYLGNVTDMKLNSHYAAALYDGNIILHLVYIIHPYMHLTYVAVYTCMYVDTCSAQYIM